MSPKTATSTTRHNVGRPRREQVFRRDVADYVLGNSLGISSSEAMAAAAAIANAVFHATGKRIRDLPIALDKLL